MVLTTHPLLAPRSRMSRSIPLLPSRPVMAGYRVNFSLLLPTMSQYRALKIRIPIKVKRKIANFTQKVISHIKLQTLIHMGLLHHIGPTYFLSLLICSTQQISFGLCQTSAGPTYICINWWKLLQT
jgi:hypothetical protein